MNIGVIGANDLGVGFSLICKSLGYDVIIFDEDENIVNNLNYGYYNTLDQTIQKKLFELTSLESTIDAIEVIDKSELIFTFIDTEQTLKGDNDTTKIYELVNHFYDANKLDKNLYNKKFIIASNLNLGDTDQIQKKLSVFNIQVAYNPYMSDMSKIIDGIYNSEIILIGTEYNELSLQLVEIYNKINLNNTDIHIMTPKAIEFTYLSMNVYSNLKFSYLRSLSDLLSESKILTEKKQIIDILEKHQNWNNFFKLSDLIKNVKTLSNIFEQNKINDSLLSAINDLDESHFNFLKTLYTTQNKEKTLSFNVTHSPYSDYLNKLSFNDQYKMCIELLDEGYSLNIFEDSPLLSRLNKVLSEYNGRIKIYKKGTNPEGHTIIL